MLKELKESEIVIITAGSGMGVDSGLPDFRGTEGFWKEYPSLKHSNLKFEEIANPKQFEVNPELVWGFYGHRYDLYKNTNPHEGFKLLLDFIKTKEDYFVLTSNVDGHFQNSKFDENKIYEIHGRINIFQCTKCKNSWEPEKNLKFNINPNTLKSETPLPKCECGEIARPNIMMFNDCLFNFSKNWEQEEKFHDFMEQHKNKKIVVIEIGAGKAIPSIRMIGENIQKKIKNSILIRINPREEEGPEGTISFNTGGLEAIKYILGGS